MDLTREAYSASDEAALNLLKRLAGRTVSVEVTFGDKYEVGVVAGILSISGKELQVKGAGTVSFELNSVDISSCRFDVRRSPVPAMGDTALDESIGVPFARLYLNNGTRIAFSRVPALPKAQKPHRAVQGGIKFVRGILL